MCVQRPNGIRFIRLHIPWPILSREAELQKIKVAVKKVSRFILGGAFRTLDRDISILLWRYFSKSENLDCDYMTRTCGSPQNKSAFPWRRTASCGSGQASLACGIPSWPKSTRRSSQISPTLTPTKTLRPASISKPSNTLLSEISSICECLLSLFFAHTRTRTHTSNLLGKKTRGQDFMYYLNLVYISHLLLFPFWKQKKNNCSFGQVWHQIYRNLIWQCDTQQNSKSRVQYIQICAFGSALHVYLPAGEFTCLCTFRWPRLFHALRADNLTRQQVCFNSICEFWGFLWDLLTYTLWKWPLQPESYLF